MVSLKAPRPTSAREQPRHLVVWVFGAWSFLASLLIFWVELMVAKMLLPGFGGSPSVWNTALVFFQANLLAGYAAAHLLAKVNSRLHKLIQTGLVALPILTLPVALPTFLDSQSTAPTIAVLISLTIMVGAPFFALATSTPTLQAWFSKSRHRKAADPYFLYALSNIGSVVGLFGYPLIIERSFTLDTQTTLWTIGYLVFAALTIVGSRLVASWVPNPVAEKDRLSFRRRFKWAATAFVPSLALLGVTRHISTDVAAFPLLWTVPLAIYLTSFVVTFREAGGRWTDGARSVLRLLVVVTAILSLGALPNLLWLTTTVTMLLLAAVSVAGHGMVYADRPAASSLTDFYLWVSIGGAAGGLFAAILAPLLFDSVIEYSLALVLAVLLVARPIRGTIRRPLLLGVIGVALFVGFLVTDAGAKTLSLGIAGVVGAVWLQPLWLAGAVAGMLVVTGLASSPDVVDHQRTFFGVYRVHDTEDLRYITNGTTLHGSQLKSDGSTPTSYYTREGPVGDVFDSLGHARLDVGVVGLGVGSIASFGQAGSRFVFYEIDPVVEQFARDERYFTALADSKAQVEVVIGDGRLKLEQEEPQHDLLVIDAFSSDAIPVHLLTLEAFELYLESTDHDGVVLVHVSNRHLDLAPVVGRIAEQLRVEARVRHSQPPPDQPWAKPSVWVVLDKVDRLDLSANWESAPTDSPLWTDEYSNILSVVDWS